MFPSFSPYQPERFLTLNDNCEFLIRIILASLLGILLGMERSARSKEAGIRTHCIVALTAAVFMILSKYAFMDLNVDGALGVRGADPARITAQVVSGISFLGAGIIFKHGHSSIKGLTTAAGMWATAGIGMAIGAGLYWVGMSATALVLLTQLIFHRYPIGYATQTEQEVHIRMQDEEETVSAFHNLLDRHQCLIDSSSVCREQGVLEMTLIVRTTPPIEHREVIAFVEERNDVFAFQVES